MAKVEFTMVSVAGKDKFIKEVNKKLEEGWQFHGNITAANTGSAFRYTQGFVKKEKTTARPF